MVFYLIFSSFFSLSWLLSLFRFYFSVVSSILFFFVVLSYLLQLYSTAVNSTSIYNYRCPSSVLLLLWFCVWWLFNVLFVCYCLLLFLRMFHTGFLRNFIFLVCAYEFFSFSLIVDVCYPIFPLFDVIVVWCCVVLYVWLLMLLIDVVFNYLMF